MMEQVEALFQQHRDRLFGLAYRMIGTVTEAEDLVQETFLRWLSVSESEIENAEAWLVKVTTHLALDYLKSARVQRRAYQGPWFPEPLIEKHKQPEQALVLDESITMALMVVLERLTPAERAAFILHDICRYSFEEVGRLLERSTVSCRQLASRARRKMGAVPSGAPTSKTEFYKVVPAFIHAIKQGNAEDLTRLLKEDVVLTSDGGGRAAAAKIPILGAPAVAKFLVRVLSPYFLKHHKPPMLLKKQWFNGAPGWVAFVDNTPITAFSFSIENGKLAHIYALRNPDKLTGFVS